ncbi:TonB-dependent receptor [Paraglaciecola aquimarina]|uniref:TonB-dependent receptor n=1 Tax=Paraglaciecola algarum TaxID=3050085 RepID=A0ABS9D9I4_9ALTE|nr:TonB-dependent receptor [Paraglaciecola sp. G1-23]MCF2949610.1 TonB-dependent receptor [Paraglaciecola sp. G1-23]
MFKKSILAAAIISCTSQAYAQQNTNQDTDELEIISVTGQRQSLADALELKREDTTIGDSIVLDEAGKVPSTSLLEILQRVPGVTMNRVRAGAEGSPDGFSFEGSGAQVRGLTKTKTLVNGHAVYSANGGNGLSWNDIGPELLKTVTVYKASRADLVEGGVAGTVNLETKMPFDYEGFHGSLSATADYGDFSDALTPALSGLISDRFDTDIGEIGVLVDLAYSKIESFDSNLINPPYYANNYNGNRVYVPSGVRQTHDEFSRIRKGYYAAVQWKPLDNLEVHHTTFASEKASNRHSLIMTNETNGQVGIFDGAEFDNNNVFVRGAIGSNNLTSGLAVSSERSYRPAFGKTSDHVTGFKYIEDNWELSGSYQFTNARAHFGKYGIGSSVTNGNNIIQTNIDVSGDRQIIDFNGQELSTAPEDTGFSKFTWLNSRTDSKTHAAHIDAIIHIDGDFFKQVKFGARTENRNEADSFIGSWWSATGRDWNGVPRGDVGSATDGDFYHEEFSDFFKGDIPSLGSVWLGTPELNQNDNFNRFIDTYASCGPNLHYQCSDPEASTALYEDRTLNNTPEWYETFYKSRNAYFMVGFEQDGNSAFTTFSGNFGLRYVKYDVESIGNFTFVDESRYYANQADADASLAAMGGIEGALAWQEANEGIQPPLTRESVGYSIDRRGSFSNDYILPSFNIKFEPADDWVARYAFTKTLTAPNSSQIRARGNASVQTTVNPINEQLDLQYPEDDISVPSVFAGYANSSGNPFLEPEIALNHDFSLEWYPKEGSSVSLSLFHKTVENYITFNNFSGPASGFFSEEDLPQSKIADENVDDSVFLDGNISSRTNFNADEDTIISGFELAGRTYFDQLDGWMSGFGIDANVTYINNDAPDAFALDINGDKLVVPVIGLSEWTYSSTLLYDLDSISARIAYNWRDDYLTTTNDGSSTRVYQDPFSGDDIQIGLPVYAKASGRLDASISYKLSDNMNVKLNVQNLTDEDQVTQMEILDDVFVKRAVFVTDRRYSLHFSMTF